MLSATALPPLRKGPFTSAHLVRWCAAQQNWHKIHFDLGYAQQRAQLPERVVNGALKQHLIVQFLEQAYPSGWLAQLDFRFVGMDLVGDTLEFRGQELEARADAGGLTVKVQIEGYNVDRETVTTTGSAVLYVSATPRDPSQAPETLPASLENLARIGEGAELAGRFGLKLGEPVETLTSDYPIDLSRLRLFADAIGGLPDRYYGPGAAGGGTPTEVVAPPLFPIHAIEMRPGSRALSTDPHAWGREGVTELGRSIGDCLGLPAESMMNGGSAVCIHSLARAGERVRGESRLLSLANRTSAKAGPIVVAQTLNAYATVTGRRLMEERVSIVYRGATL